MERELAIKQRIEAALWKEDNRLRRGLLRTPKPSRLWHYTSADGLLGILASKSFWATDAFYLSDANELWHASRLAETVLSKTPPNFHPNIVSWVHDRFCRLNATTDPPYRVHVVSFCAKRDLLSQWHCHGLGGAGYSIGLRTKDLGPVYHWTLYRVHYDEHFQKKLFERVVSVLCEATRRLFEDLIHEFPGDAEWRELVRLEIQDQVRFHLLSFLAQTCAALKNPSFREEAEWRVVRFVAQKGRSQDDDKLEFRANCGIVRPYRKWTLDPLPIASILKGPTLESELAKRSLADFVRHHQYKGVEIDVSRIPLRPCF